jgi:hypothetical protein
MDDHLVGLVLRSLPFAIFGGGLLVVGWLLRTRLASEIENEVLEALSETEALPPSVIRQRAPLASLQVDVNTLLVALENLRREGRVVRWYDRDGHGPAQPVYRRIGRPGAEA